MTRLDQRSGCRWWAVLAVAIGVSGSVNLPCRAQVRTGSLVGVVVDTGGRPLPLIEAVLTGLAARALTDDAGRFRFERIPAGRHLLLIRGIGQAPRRLSAAVFPDSVVNLGRIVLERRAQLLPPIEVAVDPVPTFNPGNLLALDEEAKGPAQFAWFGASMTNDGLYLIPSSYRQPRLNEWTVFRVRPDSDAAPRGAGAACVGNGAYRIAATKVVDGENPRRVAILGENGVIWSGPVGPTRIGECQRVTRLPIRGRLTAAAGIDSGWAAVLPTSNGRVLRVFGESGQSHWEMPLDQLFGGGSIGGTEVTVTPTRSGMIVATLAPPFRWVEVSRAGAVLVRSGATTGEALGDSLRSQVGTGWRAFGVFPIPNGYVQTVETDRREVGWHVVYDLQGRPVTRVERGPVNVIVASRPEGRKVFGFGYRKGPSGTGQLFMLRF